MIGIGISNGFQKVAIMIKGYIKEKGMFTIAKKSTHKLYNNMQFNIYTRKDRFW